MRTLIARDPGPPPPPPEAGGTGEGWIGLVYLGPRANFIRRHRQVVSLVVLAVSVATCLVMCAASGWATIGHRLAHLAWWCIPVMLAAHLTAYVGYLTAHHQVVNRTRTIALGWRRDMQIVVIGFGGWLVGGGFTVDRRALEIVGATHEDATISTVALGLLELLVLVPPTWVCALMLIGHRGIPTSVIWPWVIGVPIGCALVLGAMRVMPLPGAAGTGRTPAAIAIMATAVGATIALAVHARRGPLVIAGVTAYWAADILALWAALRFFSVSLGPAELIVAYATGYILTRRSLPFAGVIVIEVLLALSLWSVGPTLATAALAVLVYRLSDFALTLVGALLAGSAVERTLDFVGVEAATLDSLDVEPELSLAVRGAADRSRQRGESSAV